MEGVCFGCGEAIELNECKVIKNERGRILVIDRKGRAHEIPSIKKNEEKPDVKD